MSTTDKNTLKQWFSKGAKPLATQFVAWMDAFWHKDEMIPVSQIEGLQAAFDRKADSENLDTVAQIVNEQLLKYVREQDEDSAEYLHQKLRTDKMAAKEFNRSSITAPCYIKITDSETISMDADFFQQVDREVLFYLQCTGQILIAGGYTPEEAYEACEDDTVRELSVYVDIDGVPVVTVFEKPLKIN
jgi:hypothetical protein